MVNQSQGRRQLGRQAWLARRVTLIAIYPVIDFDLSCVELPRVSDRDRRWKPNKKIGHRY